MSRLPAFLVLAVAIAPPAAWAHSHKARGVEVVHPWTVATSDKGATVRVFMKIKNRGGATERLVGASTASAAKTELQEHVADGAGKPIAAVSIAAGKETALASNGPHLVLTGVTKRLNAYDSFKLTLIFEKAGRMVVDVAVEEADTEEPHKH